MSHHRKINLFVLVLFAAVFLSWLQAQEKIKTEDSDSSVNAGVPPSEDFSNVEVVLPSSPQVNQEEIRVEYVTVKDGVTVFCAITNVIHQVEGKIIHYQDPRLITTNELHQLQNTLTTFHSERPLFWENALFEILSPHDFDYVYTEDDNIIRIGASDNVKRFLGDLAQDRLSRNRTRIAVDFSVEGGWIVYDALQEIQNLADLIVNWDYMDPKHRPRRVQLTNEDGSPAGSEVRFDEVITTAFKTPPSQPLEWRMVMREVLRPHKYDFIESEGVVRPMTKQAVDNWRQEQIDIEPMVSKIVRIHHVNPEHIVTKINELDGKLGVFRHSNGSIDVLHSWNTDGKNLTQSGIKRIATAPAVRILDVKENIEAISERIANIDTRDRQVMIEARILDLGKASTRDLGFLFDQFGGSVRISTRYNDSYERSRIKQTSQNYLSSHSIKQAYSRDAVQPENLSAENAVDIELSDTYQRARDAYRDKLWGAMYDVLLNPFQMQAAWSMIQNADDAKIVSQPVLVMADHTESLIEINTEVPYVNLMTEYQAESGNTIQGYSWETLNIGIELRVASEITADGHRVRLSVFPRVTDNVGFVSAPDGSQRPILDVRELDTRVTVVSGNTLMMGGLIRTTKGEIERKVPFLGDIPILGRLFRWDSTNEERRNLVMMITPTILDDDNPDSGYEDPALNLSDPELRGMGRYSSEAKDVVEVQEAGEGIEEVLVPPLNVSDTDDYDFFEESVP